MAGEASSSRGKPVSSKKQSRKQATPRKYSEKKETTNDQHKVKEGQMAGMEKKIEKPETVVAETNKEIGKPKAVTASGKKAILIKQTDKQEKTKKVLDKEEAKNEQPEEEKQVEKREKPGTSKKTTSSGKKTSVKKQKSKQSKSKNPLNRGDTENNQTKEKAQDKIEENSEAASSRCECSIPNSSTKKEPSKPKVVVNLGQRTLPRKNKRDKYFFFK